MTVDIETLTAAIQREYGRERRVLAARSRAERRRQEEEIQRLLQEKRMLYSAMNAEIVTDILDTSVAAGAGAADHADLIRHLKQQLSTSLRAAAEESAGQQQQPRGLPEQPRSRAPATPPAAAAPAPAAAQSISFERVNSADRAEDFYPAASVQPSVRVPKSHSSALTARASLFAKRLRSGPGGKQRAVSEQRKRTNIQRLMYDPRRKL